MTTPSAPEPHSSNHSEELLPPLPGRTLVEARSNHQALLPLFPQRPDTRVVERCVLPRNERLLGQTEEELRKRLESCTRCGKAWVVRRQRR